MAANPEVKVNIVGDASSLTKEAAKADAAMAKFGKSTGTASAGATGLKGKLGELASALPGGSGALDKLGMSAEGAGGSLMAMAGPAAAGALLGFAKKGVDAFQALGGEVLKFQRVAGTSAETSSKWVEVMSDYGVAADAGAASIGKLAKNASGGAAGLQAVGVEVAKNANGTVDLNATLENVASAYAATTDATKRAAIGTAAFGKSWQSMAPILEKGAIGVKDALDGVASSKILNQQDLRDSEQFRLALDDIHDAAEGLMIQIGKGLVPALKDGSKATAEFVGLLDKATQPIGGLSNVVGVLADSLNPLTPIMKAFGNQSEENAKQADLFVKAVNAVNVATTAVDPIIAGVTEYLKKNTKATEEQEKAWDKLAIKASQDLTKGLQEAAKAEKDLLRAGESLYVSQANDLPAAIDSLNGKLLSYYDAVKNAKDETKKHGEASAEAQRATIELNNASRDLVGGIDGVAMAASNALGPNATAAEQYQAQQLALADLKIKFPELATQIDLYTQGALQRYNGATHDAATATRDIGIAASDTQVAVQVAADAAARAWSTAAGQIQASADAMERSAGSNQRAADAAAGSTAGGPGDVAPTIATGGGGAPSLHRAAGGPVSAGSSYVVGEVGPELFVPKVTGYIIPHDKLPTPAGFVGRGPEKAAPPAPPQQQYPTINIYAIDAKGVIDALAKAKRQNPALFAQLVA